MLFLMFTKIKLQFLRNIIQKLQKETCHQFNICYYTLKINIHETEKLTWVSSIYTYWL